MASYLQKIDNPKYFVNMDEMCVLLNRTTNRTVHPTGEKNAAILINKSSPERTTIAASVKVDGSK